MSTKRKTRTPKATLIGWRDGDERLTALEDQLRELVEARAKHNENMLRWRKTTNDLIDTLDRGLRKLEEKSEANAEHQELAARIDGLKADFERFRSDARDRLARVEGDKEPGETEPIHPGTCEAARGRGGAWIVTVHPGGIVHFVSELPKVA